MEIKETNWSSKGGCEKCKNVDWKKSLIITKTRIIDVCPECQKYGFNLSSKIYNANVKQTVKDSDGLIRVEDVREFIKKLKEHLHLTDGEMTDMDIDKLAGDDLVK